MVKIAHISDLHLPPLPIFGRGEKSLKRALGYLSWHRKRKHVHRVEVIEALLEDLQAQNPDHIHIGGDLTNLGLDAEYEQARDFLGRLGTPKTVSLIPGNHDHYRARMPLYVWMGYCDAEFPWVRIIDNIALIGLNSAVPTAPFMANGRVDDAQLAKLAALLDKHKDKMRIVSLHHPPQDNACAWHRDLWNKAAFQDVIREHGAEAVLHGHLHKPMVAFIGETPVLGAGSCSSYPSDYVIRAHYQIIHADGPVQHRFYDTQDNKFKDIDEIDVENH